MYERAMVQTIMLRLTEPRRFIQIVSGPRQTGKTTAITQALSKIARPNHFASADLATTLAGTWIRQEWQQARLLAERSPGGAVLVLDEVQKIDDWSAYVKALWDEDARTGANLVVLLSGSSSLLLKKGLSESLMGRFEIIRCTHWGMSEMREAFGYELEDYLRFGGYPGAAPLRNDTARWLAYMQDAIVEATIGRDILQMQEVRKPALLRALYNLGAAYSGRELSYRKILGQLTDRGNVDVIAHYLELLDGAGLLCGLQKYSGNPLNVRKSSPRFMVYDPSLAFAARGADPSLLTQPDSRGHLVEGAVGAYLLSLAADPGVDVFWWREGNAEVDFVVRSGVAIVSKVTAIEVKSGRVRGARGGLIAFHERFPDAQLLTVGSDACSIEDFLEGKFADFLL